MDIQIGNLYTLVSKNFGCNIEVKVKSYLAISKRFFLDNGSFVNKEGKVEIDYGFVTSFTHIIPINIKENHNV